MDLSDLYRQLQEQTTHTSAYDHRFALTSMDVRSRLLNNCKTTLMQIAGQPVVDCLTIDGYKFRLADNSWLMIRFSGEPVLRLCCELLPYSRCITPLLGRKQWAEN